MNKTVLLAFLAGVLIATFVGIVPATIKKYSPV